MFGGIIRSLLGSPAVGGAFSGAAHMPGGGGAGVGGGAMGIAQMLQKRRQPQSPWAQLGQGASQAMGPGQGLYKTPQEDAAAFQGDMQGGMQKAMMGPAMGVGMLANKFGPGESAGMPDGFWGNMQGDTNRIGGGMMDMIRRLMMRKQMSGSPMQPGQDVNQGFQGPQMAPPQFNFDEYRG